MRELEDSMELLYLYIKHYNGIFYNTGINFSSNYLVEYRDNELRVSKRDTVKGYYGDVVSNVTLLLGKNGAGKTTILDILGMRRDDRSSDNYLFANNSTIYNGSYFMLYHLYDEYYAFEFVSYGFLDEINGIKNINMHGRKENDALYKVPMGTVFRYENGVFTYVDNIVLQWMNNKRVGKTLKYAYINLDKYNSRIFDRNIYNEYDYMFRREYFISGDSYEYLYKYLLFLNKKEMETPSQKNIGIKNSIEFDYSELHDNPDDKILYQVKRDLDNILGIENDYLFFMSGEKYVNQKAMRESKEEFIDYFYATVIEFYILKGIYFELKSKYGIPEFETPFSKLQYDNTLKFDSEIIYDFPTEYAIIRNMIEKGKEDGDLHLNEILEYVVGRVELMTSEYVDPKESDAIREIIVSIQKIPKEYFSSKTEINIPINVTRPSDEVMDFFHIFDNYYKLRISGAGANSLSRMIDISFPPMSEGQRIFIDIISKCVTAINEGNSGDTIVLLIDEPDRAIHPELSRRFMDVFLGEINKCSGYNVQVVMSSHSPFIVTDILPENTYVIENGENNIRKIEQKSNLYANNIYAVLKESFMLDNTFGEYSFKYISRVFKDLKETDGMTRNDLDNIRKFVDRIGEITIKSKLQDLIQKKDPVKNDIISRIKSENSRETLEKIRTILEKNAEN